MLDPVEVVGRWPYRRYKRYRAYYYWWREREFRLHGFANREDDEESDEPFTVESIDSNPFAGKTWGTERAETPR